MAENLPAHWGRLHRQDRNGLLGQENGRNPVRAGRKVSFGQENGRNPARTEVDGVAQAERDCPGQPSLRQRRIRPYGRKEKHRQEVRSTCRCSVSTPD